MAVEQWVGLNEEGSDPLLHEGCECRFELTRGAGFDDHQFLPDRIRRRLHVSCVGLSRPKIRIYEEADHGGVAH